MKQKQTFLWKSSFFFISCFNYCLQTSFENVHFILYFRRCKWHENEVEKKTLKKGIKTTEMFSPSFETAIIFNIQMVFFYSFFFVLAIVTEVHEKNSKYLQSLSELKNDTLLSKQTKIWRIHYFSKEACSTHL